MKDHWHGSIDHWTELTFLDDTFSEPAVVGSGASPATRADLRDGGAEAGLAEAGFADDLGGMLVVVDC